MVESVAEPLLLGHSTFVVVASLAFATVGLLLAVPAVSLIPPVDEYERELRMRRALPLGYVPLGDRVARYAARILFVFVVVFLLRACAT